MRKSTFPADSSGLRRLSYEGAANNQTCGIIGAGRTSPAHIRALRRLPGVEITEILDHNSTAAQDVANRFGIPRQFTNPDQFYDNAKSDVVHIVTPPHTHEQLAAEALERRVHVLFEKPSLDAQAARLCRKRLRQRV